MSNQIVPVKTWALALQSTSWKPNKMASNPEANEDKSKAKWLKALFRSKILWLLWNKLALRLWFQADTSENTEEQNIGHVVRFDLSKLQKIQGFISTTHTGYKLLFWEMKHVVIHPYADSTKKAETPKRKKWL